MYGNINQPISKIKYYDIKFTKRIIYVIPLCFLTGLLCIIRGQLDCAITEWFVFISSIIHWNNAKPFGIARNFDLIVVQLSLWYHLYIIWIIKDLCAFIIIFISMSLFGISLSLNNIPNKSIGYNFHILGWIFACLSNIILSNTRLSYLND